MDKDKRSGYRTLLLSVLLSAPGPLVLGLGLMVGHSSARQIGRLYGLLTYTGKIRKQ